MMLSVDDTAEIIDAVLVDLEESFKKFMKDPNDVYDLKGIIDIIEQFRATERAALELIVKPMIKNEMSERDKKMLDKLYNLVMGENKDD